MKPILQVKVRKSLVSLFVAWLVFAMIAGVWQINPVFGTFPFSDDYELNNMSKWTSLAVDSGNFCNTTAIFPHKGNYAQNSTMIAWTSNARARYEGLGEKTDAYARVYVNITRNWPYYANSWSRSLSLLELCKNGGNYNSFGAAKIYCTGSDDDAVGHFAFKGGSGSGAFSYIYNETLPSLNTQYCIEIRAKANSTGNNGLATLWIDGSLIVNITNAGTADASFNTVQTGLWGTNGDVNILEATFDDLYVSDSPIGTTDISYANVGASNNYAGLSCTYHVLCTPTGTSDLDFFIFGNNNTGTFTNASDVAFSGSGPLWANATITNNGTVVTVQWQTWFNDTDGNTGTTGLQNNTLIEPSPDWSAISVIGQRAGYASHLNIQWSAVVGTTLDTSIFCWNNTGIFANTTLALSGSPAWHNFTAILNTTANEVVVAWFLANNTLNQWTRTSNVTYVAYNNSMALHFNGKSMYDDTNATIVFKGANAVRFIDTPLGDWVDKSGTVYWDTWNYARACDNLNAMAIWGFNSIRLVGTIEWWADNTDAHRDIIKNFTAEAALRGIYIIMAYWRVNGTGGQTGLPYPPTSNNNGWIESASKFAEFWANVSLEMRFYSNVLFEFWNEPSNTAEWSTVMQNCTDQIRKYCINSVVAQSGTCFWINLASLPPVGGHQDMDWVEAWPVTDYMGNILYSMHIYRDNLQSTPNCYTVADLTTALYDYPDFINEIVNTLDKPLWIGEIGPNQWNTGDLTNEYAFYNNTLYLLNQWGVGYSAWWWWITGNAWGHFGSGTGFIPNAAGLSLICNINSAPFVWTVGNETVSGSDYIYSNNTSWSSSWNSGAKQLSVSITGSGSAKLRVFWNISSTYALNNTLKVNFSNGTVVNFEDYFNSTTNLGIFPLSLTTLTITIGYNMDGAPSAGSPSASTTVEASTCTISSTLTDDVGLVSGILSTNRTSAWVNNTVKSLSGLSYAFSDSVVLPSATKVFGYKIFVSDSAGQWTTSSTYTFITTSQGSTPPQGPSGGGYSKFLCMFTVSSNGRALQDLKIRIWENDYTLLIETLQTDSEGYVETELPSGTYEYSADFGGQTKRGYVLLDDAKKITIDFDSAQKSTFDRSSLIKVSFALVVVACAIVAVLAVKNRH